MKSGNEDLMKGSEKEKQRIIKYRYYKVMNKVYDSIKENSRQLQTDRVQRTRRSNKRTGRYGKEKRARKAKGKENKVKKVVKTKMRF